MDQSVFSKLLDVTRSLDRKLPELTTSVEERQQFSAPRALRKISEMRKEANQLQKNTHVELNKVTERTKFIQELQALAASLVKSTQESVSTSEQFLKQYGYVPCKILLECQTDWILMRRRDTRRLIWIQTVCKADFEQTSCKQETSAPTDIEVQSGKEEDSANNKAATTPKQTVRPPGQRRTPKMEEFGISDSTLKVLKEMSKKDLENREKSKTVTKSSVPEIPSPFQHNGFICTPSLFPSSINQAMSEGHASLASPEHINIGKSLENAEENIIADPRARLGFDTLASGSPKSPVLQTPGFKELMAGATRVQHSNTNTMEKAKASVSLFKATEKEEKKPYAYDDDEPQEPELTYSLEAIREMTGMFTINPKQLPPAVMTLPHTENKENAENTTPSEPELLSERVAKVNKEAAANSSSTVKPRALYGDMPESPEFFMKYDFLNK